MNKSLLVTAAFLASSLTASFAQNNWQKGDEITDQVNWGNLSFTNDPFDVWTLESSKGSFTQTGGLFETYDGADVNLYQYVQLPAGMYTVQCQGYYRCGNSWADDPSVFNTEDWQDNALLYVSNGTYNIEDNSFIADRTFKTPLMPRLFEGVQDQIYVDEVKSGWDMSDGHYDGPNCWGPCSVPGSLAWFNAGYYKPYVNEDDGIKYNTVTFFLTKDGYVKLGVMKTDPRSADSFMVTNFKLYYQGEAGEAAELMAQQDEVAEYYHMLENLGKSNESMGAISVLINDAIGVFDDEVGSIDDLDTKEKCAAALENIKAQYEAAVAAVTANNQIIALLKSCDILDNSTDYAGKAAFDAVVTKAKAYMDPAYEMQDTDTFATLQTLYDELAAARMAYLMSQTPDNGAYNFSSSINNAFMCDNEYTPTWDAESKSYKYNADIEDTFGNIQEQDYKAVLTEHADWTDFASNVAITQKDVEGQWVINTTTWHGSGFDAITMQHGYTAIGGWTASPTGNAEIMYQTISGLPNGYYAMSGLMCNAGAEVSSLQYVFIEADGQTEKAQLTQKGNPWWGGSRDQWRQTVWQKLQTNMIYVANGKAKIGSSSDAFYAVTGFQLYYYGENPDFTALVAPSIATVKESIDALAFPGDKTAATAIISQIPATIDGNEAYVNALKTIEEANNYITTANAAVNTYTSSTLNSIEAWVGTFEDGSDESAAAGKFFEHAFMVGSDDNPNDTYKTALATTEDFTANANYIAYIDAAKKYSSDADVAAVIAEQMAYLKDNYADAAKIAELKEQLAAPYNKALLASVNADKATETSPVDVTALIINPSFEQSKTGWNGSFTVDDSLRNAEVYNANFDVYQTIDALPAGVYTVTMDGFYRDGSMTNAYTNYAITASRLDEFWETGNAILYMSSSDAERGVSIRPLAAGQYTEPSFTSYISSWQKAVEGDAQGNDVYEPVYSYIDLDNLTSPFDVKIESGEEDPYYYFANSMRGGKAVFEKNDGVYKNTLSIYVKEGQSLTIGVRKNTTIDSDWCMFDNFRLSYLGTAIPTAINGMNATAAANTVYSVAGVRQSSLKNGVNIVKMSDGSVKKVMK